MLKQRSRDLRIRKPTYLSNFRPRSARPTHTVDQPIKLKEFPCNSSFTHNFGFTRMISSGNLKVKGRFPFDQNFREFRGPSIKPGTSNIPEHPGTSNNYDDYEKKMCKLQFWACSRAHLERSDWSRNMFLFSSRITLLRNESHGRTFHHGKSIEKVHEVPDY